MILDLGEDAKEYGRQALRAFAAAGGDQLVQQAEAKPGERESLAGPILTELGAWDLDVFSDTERMKALSEATGGSIRRVADASGTIVPRLQSVRSGRLSGADWIGFRPSDSANIRGVEVYPLALGLAALAALAAAVLAMWLVEGRWGRSA